MNGCAWCNGYAPKRLIVQARLGIALIVDVGLGPRRAGGAAASSAMGIDSIAS